MTPIVHITDKEQALQRENERLVDKTQRQSATIHTQAVAIQAMTEEIEGWKADQKENIAVTFRQQAEIDKLKAACDKFSESEMLLKAQPVQPAQKELNALLHEIDTQCGNGMIPWPIEDAYAAYEAAVRTGGAG